LEDGQRVRDHGVNGRAIVAAQDVGMQTYVEDAPSRCS
jgi:hypothetical protein